jgi:hypothetical protein
VLRRISSIRMHRVREIAHTVGAIAAAAFLLFMAVGGAAFAVLMVNLNEKL